MNNFEILNLLESRYGKIPTIARAQLLDIFNIYNLELNQIEFSLKPIRELNSFFKQLHLNGVRNEDHSILKRVLNNGSLFEYEINEYLFDNDEESPFSILHIGFEVFDKDYNEYILKNDSQTKETDTTGKAKGKITNTPNKKQKSKIKPCK
ncbi:MAG: hypothetical protein RPS47_14820 [Colwellia sp.]|jgi:hypothetical protein